MLVQEQTTKGTAKAIRENLAEIQRSVTKSRQLLKRVEAGEITEECAMLIINSRCHEYLFRGDEVSRLAMNRRRHLEERS